MTAVPPEVSDLSRAELVAEVRRLRGLVGPSERSYAARVDEVRHASDAVRAAEAANGELRGEMARMESDLGRLRASQGRIHRLIVHRLRTLVRVGRSAVGRLRS
ncbi:hypothetical protein [Ilumatobacter sp.]|uniref:hypothetical protein n=1 Tax=Ilumatobacter sp. TaxID=1967498 RepID=UPI003B52548D